MKLGLDYVPDVYESSVCEEVFKIVSIEPWFMYFEWVRSYTGRVKMVVMESILVKIVYVYKMNKKEEKR